MSKNNFRDYYYRIDNDQICEFFLNENFDRLKNLSMNDIVHGLIQVIKKFGKEKARSLLKLLFSNYKTKEEKEKFYKDLLNNLPNIYKEIAVGLL